MQKLNQKLPHPRTITQYNNKIQYKNYHTVGTVLKIQSKIVERCRIDIPNIQIHDQSLSCLGTGTSMKSEGVKLVFPPLVCRTVHVQFVIYVCLRMVVSNTYCVVLLFCFVFVLCTLCCQFLWIVHCYCLFYIL